MRKATENQTVKDWVEWLILFRKNKYNLSKDECLAIRDAITTYSSVAEKFFFETIIPMCNGLAHKIFETYKVVINIRDISTWVYAGMYGGGKWTRFSTYRGDQSIFAWTATCASQIVFKELDKQHLIPPSSDLNATNTALTLKSMQNVEEIKMVIDLVDVPELHSVLTMIYVDRMTDEQIMAEKNMPQQLFRKTLRTAEAMLKEALIDKESMLVVREDGKIVNLVREALSDCSGVFQTSTSDDAMAIAEKQLYTDNEENELHVLQSQFRPGLPFLEQWVLFVVDRAQEMKWSTEEQTVFYERFYNNEDPVALARRLGRRRTWVDNKYHNLNQEITSYITRWLNANIKKQEKNIIHYEQENDYSKRSGEHCFRNIRPRTRL